MQIGGDRVRSGTGGRGVRVNAGERRKVWRCQRLNQPSYSAKYSVEDCVFSSLIL